MKEMNKIPFNKPYLHGRELVYIAESVASGKISGDGIFSKKCHDFFTRKYNFQKVLLTTSCTDALEMCALLLDIEPGDEVIVPAYTFVSSANAFALRGAKIIFADSQIDNPNISCEQIESLINSNTKAIVVVHYAGIACDMDIILSLAGKYNIPVVEDAAQSVDSFYKGRALGGIGELGTFSFHETKNVIAGEGGLLSINNSKYVERAEIIREKGTNRSSFFRGEVNKYGWVDIGSSFLPSDIIAAYLYAQLENIETIQNQRKNLWQRYWNNLSSILPDLGIMLPAVPEWATNNAHMFYIVCSSIEQRSELIDSLKQSGVQAVFHYLSLHNSPYFHKQHDGRPLINSDRFENCLLRLPLYYELTNEEVDYICGRIIDYLKTK
jgi:dTDP-4-amino-4,6-dideoxygalactose transaminase